MQYIFILIGALVAGYLYFAPAHKTNKQSHNEISSQEVGISQNNIDKTSYNDDKSNEDKSSKYNYKNNDDDNNTSKASGNFDFYVLALSWSPTYCITARNPDKSQCNGGYGFVVHGLWPQNEHGYPQNCTSNYSHLDQSIVKSMLDIMPSEGLIRHEWEKHGLCSGLSPKDYFATVRKAYEKVNVPSVSQIGAGNNRITAGNIESIFTKRANGLSNDEIAVQAQKGNLSEVRICMTKQLDFRACDEVDKGGSRDNYRVFVPQPNN